MERLTTINVALSGKQLELLKELIPGIFLVAVLLKPDEADAQVALREMGLPAQTMGIQLESFHVSALGDFDKAFSAIVPPENS